MHRFASAVFAVALGQAVVVPLPLTAQHRNALTAGVTTAARASEGRELAKSGQRPSPPIWPDADSTAKKLSLGRHVLVGASIGMVAALAIVTYGQ